MNMSTQSKAGCDHLADEIKKRESKVHILVNNSGATWGAPYDKCVCLVNLTYKFLIPV